MVNCATHTCVCLCVSFKSPLFPSIYHFILLPPLLFRLTFPTYLSKSRHPGLNLHFLPNPVLLLLPGCIPSSNLLVQLLCCFGFFPLRHSISWHRLLQKNPIYHRHFHLPSSFLSILPRFNPDTSPPPPLDSIALLFPSSSFSFLFLSLKQKDSNCHTESHLKRLHNARTKHFLFLLHR